MSFVRGALQILLLAMITNASTSYAGADADRSYAQHAFWWQTAWTGVFSSSLFFNVLVVTSDNSSREQKFDSRLSLFTSGSGLMSVIVNPLPVAYADEAEWDANPEIVRLTEIEVQRRRGTGHLTFMFAEQLLVAAAIGVYDNRPIDAWRRLAVGSITSLAFAWSTPTRTGAQLPTLHLRYDGKTLHAGLHREF